MPTRRLIIATLSIALLAGCHATPAVMPTATADGTVVRLLIRRDLPLARATVNGQDVGYFLIDTGSTTTVLDVSTAQKLHVGVTRRTQVMAVGGEISMGFGQVSDLNVGGIDFGPRSTAVVDLDAFRRTVGFPVAGVLGHDALLERMFTIELSTGELIVHDTPGYKPQGRGQAMELRYIDGLLAARGAVEGVPAWLQIDTGSNAGISLAMATIRERPGLVAGKYNVETMASGAGGATGVVKSTLGTVTAFGSDVSDVPLQIEKTPMPNQPGPDGELIVGRLGNGVLKHFRLTFDFPHGRLYAERVD